MEKKNRKIPLSRLIGLLILLVLLLFVLFPDLIPFLSEGLKQQIRDGLTQTFGSLFDNESRLSLSVPKLFSIAAVILSVSLLSWLLRLILNKTAVQKRSRTVVGLIVGAIKYTGILVIIIWSLHIIGVDLTAIFASVGIVGLVVGFGAQSLIEDIITGVFIIIEGQYSIGDIIILDDFRGEVDGIGVRTTRLVDAGGNIKIINNSDIRNLQNRSEKLSYALCDVGTSYRADLEELEAIFSRELEEISARCAHMFPSGVLYRGVQELGESAVVVRFVGQLKEADIFNGQRMLNREIKLMFDRNKIEIPFNQLVIHNDDKKTR